MNLKLVGLNEDLLKVVEEVNKIVEVTFTEQGEEVLVSTLEEAAENCIEICRGNNNYIKYKEKNHFFRALGLYIQLSKNGTEYFERKERSYIPYVGAMIDASRNAVYKVEEVKNMILKMALMGHNTYMLYTEDTYEIEGYEYFGYLRGKYSIDELKEIDDYAYSLGVEVVPCIQTLAHLKQTLRWDYAPKDTEDILMVGDERTYKFVEAMMSSLRNAFRSRRVHIGMDEAWDLGRGAYLTKHGHVHHYEIMIEHLKKVCEICDKYEFKPMMWDDMFFRAGAPNGNYYDLNAKITEDITSQVPSNLSLVYWDYYNKDEEFYKKFLDIRDKFNNPVIFAGGVWRWNGYVPSYTKTFATTNAALKQCKLKGIKEVFATAWGDDGSETPVNSIMLGLVLFAEHAYGEHVNESWLNKRCEFITGLTTKDFEVLEELDLLPTVKRPNLDVVNPTKYVLYQDILLGAFDRHLKDLDLSCHYNNLTKKYEEISRKGIEYKEMFLMYSKLSDFLSIKWNLGLKIREAYSNSDKEELRNIIVNIIPELVKKLDVFQESFRVLWYKECKGQGFEVIDIRLGGIKSRVNSTIYRLNQYINGEIGKIEELEEELLYFANYQKINDESASKFINYNRYATIATQNILSW